MNTFTGHRSFAAGAWHLLGRHFIFYFIAKVRREGRVHRELSASLRLPLSLPLSLCRFPTHFSQGNEKFYVIFFI